MMATMLLSGCFGGKSASSSGRGGEVVGVSGRGFKEPTPYGMTLVKRGSLRMGVEKQDSLWGKSMPVKDISVDGFWMDETEVTNSQYKQFVHWVRDSILRTRLADPSYGGDESYMITEDKNGDPVTPHLNWNKRLPRKPTEDELRAFESLYVTNPATGEKMLDARQLNYRYEIYDYTAAALRRNRLNPQERNLNTDITVDPIFFQFFIKCRSADIKPFGCICKIVIAIRQHLTDFFFFSLLILRIASSPSASEHRFYRLFLFPVNTAIHRHIIRFSP